MRDAQELPDPLRVAPFATARFARPASVALLLIVLAVFVHDRATAPFGSSAVTASMGVYCELMAQAWNEFGFARSLGVPMFSCLGETVVERVPYAHQAPAGWWWPYFGRTLFGKGSVGFRAFPVGFCALGALFLALLVRRRAGDFAGLVAALTVLFVPVVVLYAGLPGIESISFAATAGFLLLWDRWRAAPTAARSVGLRIAFLVGSQLAWSFYLLVPGLFVAEWLRGPNERRLRRVLVLFALGGLGFTLVILHLRLALGSFDAVFGRVFATAREVLTKGITDEHRPQGLEVKFWPAQTRFFSENVGAPLGIALLASLVLLLGSTRWRRDPSTGYGLVFLGQGLLSVILFNARSNTHGYYWFLVGPGIAVLLLQGTRALAALLATKLRSGVALGIAGAILVALIGGSRYRAEPLRRALEAEGLAGIAAAIDAQIPPEDWVASLDPLALDAMLYSERRWTPPLLIPADLDAVLAARDSGRLRFGKLWFSANAAARARFPDVLRHAEVRAARTGAPKLEVPDGTIVFVL